MAGWFDAMFGRIFSRGTELELEGGLNFTGGLVARTNRDAGTIDVVLGEPSVFDVTEPVYGARGDGSTVNDDAIEAAVSAANAAGGGVVYFPDGVYIIDSRIRPYPNITFRGASRDTTIIRRKANNTAPFDMFGGGDDPAGYNETTLGAVRWEHLTLDGNRQNQAGDDENSAVISISNSTNQDYFVVEDCRVVNFSYGGMGVHIKGASFVRIADTEFRDGGDSLFHAIYIRRVAYSIVRDNFFKDIGADFIKIQSVDQGDYAAVTGNVGENGGRGVLIQDTSDFVVANNILGGIADAGIAVTQDSGSDGQVNGSIVGNVIRDTVQGIYVQLGFDVVISGNAIRECTEFGIKTRNCENVIVSSNVIRNTDAISAAEWYGIITSDGPTPHRQVVIEHNSIRSTATGTAYGIYIEETDGTIHLGKNFFGGDLTTRELQIRVADETQLSLGTANESLRGTDPIAASVWAEMSSINSTDGAVTATLADGPYPGFRKVFRKSGNATASTLTIANHIGGNDVVYTFSDTGQTLELFWSGSEWHTTYDTTDPEVLRGTDPVNASPWREMSSINSIDGAVTATLGDGIKPGFVKTFRKSGSATASTLTVTNHRTSDPEVFTFTSIGSVLVLEWVDAEWHTIYNSGVAT